MLYKKFGELLCNYVSGKSSMFIYLHTYLPEARWKIINQAKILVIVVATIYIFNKTITGNLFYACNLELNDLYKVGKLFFPLFLRMILHLDIFS